MEIRRRSKAILYGSLIANLGLLAYSVKKDTKKEWLFAYVINVTTNVIIDKFLIQSKALKYPVRLFPRFFKINILFDVLVYPTNCVVFNQWTSKDRNIVKIISKLLTFSIPFTIIEGWFHSKTHLIKWERGYKWYHTFIGLTTKSLLTRYSVKLFEKYQRNSFPTVD